MEQLATFSSPSYRSQSVKKQQSHSEGIEIESLKGYSRTDVLFVNSRGRVGLVDPDPGSSVVKRKHSRQGLRKSWA